MEIDHEKFKLMLSDYYKQGYETCFSDVLSCLKIYRRVNADFNDDFVAFLDRAVAHLISDYNTHSCLKNIDISEDMIKWLSTLNLISTLLKKK